MAKTRVVKASGLLKQKVGTGRIDRKTLERCQKVVEKSAADFAPLAHEHLRQLQDEIETARKRKKRNAAELSETVTVPVMQIKANAGMSGYPLVSRLAGIMLSFLETIETVDDDVLDILDAHRKTLDVIVSNEMKGDGGSYGVELQKELRDACRRYFARQASSRKDDTEEPFFVD